MKKNQFTEQDIIDVGYEYLGEYGGHTKDHRANQLWRYRDELIIYDPEEERIVWREYNEPRYQQNYSNKPNSDLHVGERRHQ